MNQPKKHAWPSGLRHSPCKRKIVSSILIKSFLYILSFFERNIKYKNNLQLLKWKKDNLKYSSNNKINDKIRSSKNVIVVGMTATPIYDKINELALEKPCLK